MKTPTFIFTAAVDSADLALAELAKAQPAAEVIEMLGEGIWAGTAVPFSSLADVWQQHPPIFVRHVCPVHLTLPLTEMPDVPWLAEAIGVDLAAWIDPQTPFSVQTRVLSHAPYKPYDINTAVAQSIQQMTAAPLDVRAPGQILSIVITQKAAYAGVSLAVYNLSDWAGGMRRFAREPGQISRAEFKLLEALELFRIALPPRGIALDLGAAPGGWTRILRQRQQYVTAVDPAALHPSLRQDKHVRHLRLTAETYRKQGPDHFDLIVNDMRLDARDSARLMVAFAPYLYAHGSALMTVKLPAQAQPALIEHTFDILQHAYRIAGARQLFHNRSEITLHLKP